MRLPETLLPGTRVGLLTVETCLPGKLRRCRCRCGGEVTVTTGDLRQGKVRSCGCCRTLGLRQYWQNGTSTTFGLFMRSVSPVDGTLSVT